MSEKIILRFRDLITEDDGTINDHQMLINKFGEVWWGWWMKQDETPPFNLFKRMTNRIEENGFVTSFLYNTGLSKIYKVNIVKILVAPKYNKINTPNPEISPSYYHRGRYPAWFLINNIEEVLFSELNLSYKEFPTRPEKKEAYSQFIEQKINDLSALKEFDLTLWVVNNSK